MQTVKSFWLRLIVFVIALFVHKNLLAQCSTLINTFPYKEGFENGNGGWFAGGTNSDWALGSPSKNLITKAAAGNNCWVTGGLTGNYYNDGERSWLQSPCFDFSNLSDPVISFDVFWDTELNYDGAGFQYSIDGGRTWVPVGNINDACPNSNWYNNNVTYLSDLGQAQGWSGSGNSGSNQWLNSIHMLSGLAGEPSVIFRFVFAAGVKYNNYNGFAVDDISISDYTNNASFTYSCINASSVKFSSSAASCNTTLSWNFNDLSSGNNTSNQNNISHTFSAPGTYTVSLTVTNASGVVTTSNQQINIISASSSVVTALNCYGDKNGSVKVDVKSNLPYSIAWNTNPVQTTSIADNLSAGYYLATVSAYNACTDTAGILLAEPKPLQVFLGNDTSICAGYGFTINAGNYNSYVWQDGTKNSSYTINRQGVYYVTVTNANACKASDTIHVIEDCGDIFFPSAFSPNGDGLNDVYGPVGNFSLIKTYHLKIYDRWGNVVFSSANPSEKWKGPAQILQATVYIYVAGYIYNGKEKTSKGTVTLIF